MGWKDTIQDAPAEASAPAFSGSWRDTIRDQEVDPTKSPVTAVTTGLMQGAVPFVGAIAGAGKTALDAVTGTRGPLAGADLSDLADDYRSTRDSFAKDADTAAEANPKLAFGANVGGGLMNPLFKEANTLPKAMGAAAIQGLGQSKADLTKPDDPMQLAEAGIDAAGGAAGGALGYGIGKAIPYIAEGAGKVGKKLLTTLGPSEEAINARLAGAAQDSAESYPELAEKMAGSAKILKAQIKDVSDSAKKTLSSEKNLPKQYISSVIDDALEQLGMTGADPEKKVLVGPAAKRAAEVLGGLKSDIGELPEQLSQKDLKSLIQEMDKNINWDDQSQNKLNQILEGLRKQFDETLKFQNPQYKAAMEPVSARMAVLNKIKEAFNLENIPGRGLRPTDTTATKVQTSLRENKAITQEALDKLKGFTGDDFHALAKDYQLAKQFDSTAPNGSRRTALGGALGGFIGHFLAPGIGTTGGAAAGAATGAVLDKYGGQALGKMIDTYLKAGNSAAFGKFAPVIQKAAAQGPQALAVVGSILGQNPEFQKLMQIRPK